MTSPKAENPLLITEGIPSFHLMKVEHVAPAVKKMLENSEKVLNKIETSNDLKWNSLMNTLEELYLPLEYTWWSIEHLTGVKNSDELRKAYEAVEQDVVAFELKLKQSLVIYQKLKKLKNTAEWGSLDESQKRVVDLRIRDSELAGISLQGKEKKRFTEIEKELTQLGTSFSNNVLDAVKAYEFVISDQKETEGWTHNLRELSSQSYNQAKKTSESTPDKGPWRITLDAPSYLPFMQHHRNRSHREEVFKAAMTKASSGKKNNTDILEQILKLRKESTMILGYKTHAEVSLKSKMASDVDSVYQMLEDLKNPSFPKAKQDLKDLENLAKEMGQNEPVLQWDIFFYSERLREKLFDYTDDELRPYFPLPKVLKGLFSLTEKLFDVKIEEVKYSFPTWHEDVSFYKIQDRNNQIIAHFYLDPYSRPEEKNGGAWMMPCLARHKITGELRLPIAHLCCNGTPPVGDKPSLMSFNEVNTLFHEFGHGLQWMLTEMEYFDVSGTIGIEWDAVELASQFMENWCYHKPTLIGLTEHIETGESLSDELFDKIYASRNFMAGYQMMGQLGYAMMDMELHNQYLYSDKYKSFIELQEKVTTEFSVLPWLPYNRMLCSFSHIFGGSYAAGYYSYKWSEILSADAFAAFEEAGLEDEAEIKKVGKHYRDTVLAKGGGRAPLDVFMDFRGRKPDPKALLRSCGIIDSAF